MSSVFAFTVSRASTAQRLKLLTETVKGARATAGLAFDWHVWMPEFSAPTALMGDFIEALQSANIILHMTKDNIGQHVAWNEAFARALSDDYDYFLRIDDDCEFKTQRWLRKLVEASVRLDDKMVLAPVVRGLNNPPTTSTTVEVKGVPLAFLIEAIGGICRLHPTELVRDYVSDVRKPLGAGDATGMAAFCITHTIPFAYCRHIRVKHALGTTGQETADPAHFADHDLFQTIPYIPAWSAP